MRRFRLACLPNMIYCPQHVALARGFFDERGLSVEVVRPPSLLGMVDLLRERRVDALLGNLWLALATSPQAQPLQAYAQSNRQCHHVLFARALKTEHSPFPPPFSWKMLEGRSVIVPSDAPTPWAALQHVLRSERVNIQRVNLVTGFGPGEALDAFGAGLGDFALLSAATHVPGGAEVAALADSLGPVPWSVYIAEEAVLVSRFEVFCAFAAAIGDALYWISQNDPEDVARTATETFPPAALHPRPAISRLMELQLWPTSPEVNMENAKRWQEILRTVGLLREEADLDRSIVQMPGSRHVGGDRA
jgi:NitT/TauT family transport system substrate-binding protein